MQNLDSVQKWYPQVGNNMGFPSEENLSKNFRTKCRQALSANLILGFNIQTASICARSLCPVPHLFLMLPTKTLREGKWVATVQLAINSLACPHSLFPAPYQATSICPVIFLNCQLSNLWGRITRLPRISCQKQSQLLAIRLSVLAMIFSDVNMSWEKNR